MEQNEIHSFNRRGSEAIIGEKKFIRSAFLPMTNNREIATLNAAIAEAIFKRICAPPKVT